MRGVCGWGACGRVGAGAARGGSGGGAARGRAAPAQEVFSLVQPALCEGGFVVHPSFGQNPAHGAYPWSHVRTAELQMPLGRVAWWDSITDKFLAGQTLGMGMDYFWAESLGYQQRCAVYDAVCAVHPARPPGHRTGCGTLPRVGCCAAGGWRGACHGGAGGARGGGGAGWGPG